MSTYHLCLACGTISLESDWTFWHQNLDEATEETPWVPAREGEEDPMALCPACKWEHQDTDDGSGYYWGTLAEMELQRTQDADDFADDWAIRLESAS